MWALYFKRVPGACTVMQGSIVWTPAGGLVASLLETKHMHTEKSKTGTSETRPPTVYLRNDKRDETAQGEPEKRGVSTSSTYLFSSIHFPVVDRSVTFVKEAFFCDIRLEVVYMEHLKKE